jgi:hypothetical protein
MLGIVAERKSQQERLIVSDIMASHRFLVVKPED